MIASIRSFMFLIGIFLLMAGGLIAQTPQELPLDTSVSGNLPSRGEQRYSVRASQNSLLTVETRGLTDTYLKAYDASNNLIAEDDDSGIGYNALLEIVVLTGMTYLFVVSGYDTESGPYQIRASQRPIPQATELRLDNIVSGNISEGQDYWYSVRPSQNSFLTVETTGDTDTLLEAYDESYSLLGNDDDGGEGFNARLRISAEAGKMYLFRLRAYSNESGPYRIRASADASATVRELDEALSSGNVTLTANGRGSSSGFSVDGFLRNNTSSEIRISVIIKNGLYLRNSSVGQNMVATQIYLSGNTYTTSGSNKFIRLLPNENTPIIFIAFCADFDRDNPTNRQSFTTASIPSNMQAIITRMSRYMADNFDVDIIVPIQLALWRNQGVTRTAIAAKFSFDNSDWETSSRIMNY